MKRLSMSSMQLSIFTQNTVCIDLWSVYGFVNVAVCAFSKVDARAPLARSNRMHAARIEP